MKGKSLLATGLIAGFLGLACKRDTVSPVLEEQPTEKTYSHYKAFDTQDALFSYDIRKRLSEVQKKVKELYPNIEINPKTLTVDGKEYILYFKVSGEGPENIDSTFKDLDWVISGKRVEPNYQRLDFGGMDIIVDAPDVPLTPELTERQKEMNESGIYRRIQFGLIPMTDKHGYLITDESGRTMINAVRITPTGTNAGDSFMGYSAIYIMTGEQRPPVFPNVTLIKADTIIPIFTYDTTGTFISPGDSTEN